MRKTCFGLPSVPSGFVEPSGFAEPEGVALSELAGAPAWGVTGSHGFIATSDAVLTAIGGGGGGTDGTGGGTRVPVRF